MGNLNQRWSWRGRVWRLGILFGVLLTTLWGWGLAVRKNSARVTLIDKRAREIFKWDNGEHRRMGMKFLSKAGSKKMMFRFDVALLLLLLAGKRWRSARFLSVAVGGAEALDLILKRGVERPRPKLRAKFMPKEKHSFPSGHALNTMSFTSSLIVLAWPTRWRWPLLIITVPFIILNGISRVYRQQHHLSDVVAGWIGALTWVIGCALSLERGEKVEA